MCNASDTLVGVYGSVDVCPLLRPVASLLPARDADSGLLAALELVRQQQWLLALAQLSALEPAAEAAGIVSDIAIHSSTALAALGRFASK